MAVFGSKRHDDQAWIDWLSDESEKPTDRHAPHARKLPSAHKHPYKKQAKPFDLAAALKQSVEAPKTQVRVDNRERTPNGRPKTIEVALNLPRVRLPKLTTRWLYVAIVGLVVVGLVFMWSRRNDASSPISGIGSSSGDFGGSKAPDFSPLVPREQGNVVNRGYDSKRGVYTYQDRYNGVMITVSQQLYPDSLRDKVALDKMTSSIQATEQYSTVHGVLYLTKASDQSSQWIVLAHRQLLVFLQSTGALKPAEWVAYVQTLQ